jgi:hypothetical protein
MNTNEDLTGRLQWLQTHDLDNVHYRILQQEWRVTVVEVGGAIFKSYTEWRSVPVVDGGLVP